MAQSEIDHSSCHNNNFWKNQARHRSASHTPNRLIKPVKKLRPEDIAFLQQKFDKFVQDHNKAPNVEQLCRMIGVKYKNPKQKESIKRPIITSSSKVIGEGDIKMQTLLKQNIARHQDYPVWPLVIPNNCSYDPKTGKMSVNHGQQRNKLVVYKPALDFIRKIGSKIATISIVGKARTGKSLIAGELYAPGKIPCPFDLGHLMDACTYGIWVSAKTIKHPYQKDTVILIFDVEGTGFHEATKQNDMQLMVITLLISSYFIYNSKGAFDSAALDEIEFVTQLTETIHATPNDTSGQDFKKFFPVFMWLLRDVHLEPTLNGKTVSAREYFTEKVLRFEGGLSRKSQTRQQLKQMIIEMFQKYDAFTLPMPIADTDLLRQLGSIPRIQLEKGFNSKLQALYQKIIKDTKGKVLFSKNEKGEDKYVQCTGPHIAGWIEQCVESVNDPNKVPQISSMTAAVMANVYRESKKNAVEQYQSLLSSGLKELRNDNEKQPLDRQNIINLHLNILNTVLSKSGATLQPQQLSNSCDEKVNENNHINQEQLKVFNEFMDEIGHNQYAINIGSKGIMYQILTKNMELSKVFCTQYLNNYFIEKINPILEKSKEYKLTHIVALFKDLETRYYSVCKGPAKDKCWIEFQTKRMSEAIKYFEQCKGFNLEILKREQEAADQRERQRQLQQQFTVHKQQSDQQTKLMKDELNRMENVRQSEMQQHQLNLKQAEQRMRDLQKSHNNKNAELMRKKKAEIDAMNKRVLNMTTQHQQTLNATIANMQNQINVLKNTPPQVVTRTIYTGGGGGGGCFGGSNKCYRKKSEFGEIEICAVSEVEVGDWMLTEKGIFSCTIHIEHSNIIMNMVCIKYENINKNKFGNIIMTDHHYIYIIQNEINELKCISAGQIKIGDKLKYICQGNEEIVKVINISKCTDYASSIMTTNGNIIISNILSSCFTTNTINLKKYLWIGQILVDYVPIKYAQIISNCFYYTNKYSKYIVKKYNKYFSYN